MLTQTRRVLASPVSSLDLNTLIEQSSESFQISCGSDRSRDDDHTVLHVDFDVVIGSDDILPGVDVEFTFGYFLVGEAFRVEVDDDVFTDADEAFLARFMINFRF